MSTANESGSYRDEESESKLEKVINRKFEERTKLMEMIKHKLRVSWRNDPAVLNQYFQSCVANWKLYTGPRTQHQVMKLQCFYRQAVHGDSQELPPENVKGNDYVKWKAYQALKGMPQDMAKRRFITYLSEIDPLLIDVMPDEKPPFGFPTDRHGQPICAKCNTTVGCSRTIVDQNKVDIRMQLFEDDSLHEPVMLRKWVKNAMQNQRCVWGMHMAITKVEAKPFMAWFNRDENQGFVPYDSSPIMEIVKELLVFHYEIGYDMTMNPQEYTTDQFNAQVVKVKKIEATYNELSGEEFVFEAPCKSNSTLCDQKRLADGGKNHTHPFELEPPTKHDADAYEDAIELRQQLMKLGLDPCTGVVYSVSERCEIYRKRMNDYYEALQESQVAKKRNDERKEVHDKEKKKVFALAKDMIARQIWDNCQLNRPDAVLTLIKRNCNPDTESPRGLTPLLCFVINSVPAEYVEEFARKRGNINYVNKFGMTALMTACRLRDTKMIHVLMKSGAAATQKAGRKGKDMTALHWCAVHGCEEEARIIADYVKEGGGDAMRVSRYLDAQNEDGDSPLHLAARRRNGLMCRVLTSLGANPNLRNGENRNAAFVGRNAGWSELADWLDKKVGAGVAKLETFSDQQYEQTCRYGAIKVKESLVDFQKLYFMLMQNEVTTTPLGCPSVARKNFLSKGDRAKKDQVHFVDNHQLYIMNKDYDDRDVRDEKIVNHESILAMKEKLVEMHDAMRKGIVNPNVESQLKPMGWTPLMCAVVLNDVRMIKLMIREGADPNYPNCHGTTAVMLAAQLNNIEALIECLLMQGDVTIVDNEGYNAMAYASSMPLPTCLDRNIVGTLLEGDADGPKRPTSSDIIKTAMAGGVQILRKYYDINMQEAAPDNVEAHFRSMRLLEQHGLTRMETARHIHHQTRTATWRVTLPEEEAKEAADDYSETSSERAEREVYEAKLARIEAEKFQKELDDDMRCPMCTLAVPCKHFSKPSILKNFLKKKGVDVPTDKKLSAAEKAVQSMKFTKKMKVADKRQQVLEETMLADRKTDRSVATAKKYRERELLLDKQAKAIEQARREKEEREEAKAEAIANGTWVEWQQHYDNYGSLYYMHSDTGEIWQLHFDDNARPFYFNPATSESRWEPPDKEAKEKLLAIANAAVQASERDSKTAGSGGSESDASDSKSDGSIADREDDGSIEVDATAQKKPRTKRKSPSSKGSDSGAAEALSNITTESTDPTAQNADANDDATSVETSLVPWDPTAKPSKSLLKTVSMVTDIPEGEKDPSTVSKKRRIRFNLPDDELQQKPSQKDETEGGGEGK